MEQCDQAEVGGASGESRKLTRGERKRLKELLWTPSTTVGVGCILVVVVGVAAGLLRVAHHLLGRALPVFAHDGWWIAAIVVVAVAATVGLALSIDPKGRRELDVLLRRDLAEGVAAVQRVSAVDAVEVEDEEDLGEAFFVLTREGETILFSFEGLDRLKRRGFPWAEFEIVEAPHSKVFLGLARRGEPLAPSRRRPPLTYDESKRFAIMSRPYRRLDVSFADLKDGLPTLSVRTAKIDHGRFVKACMLVFTALFSTGFVMMYHEEGVSLTSLVLGAGAVLGVAAIVQVFASRIVLGEDALRIVLPWSRKTYPRSDIRSVTWERGEKALLELSQDRRVKLPDVGKSHQEVADVVRAWLKSDRRPSV
jgi:hypothetical protein